jgi:hypothetical protein
MWIRTNKQFTALICLGAYMLTVLAPGGWMVWCIGTDGHRALELTHQSGVPSKGGSMLSVLDQSTHIAQCPAATHSYPGIAISGVACTDTPVVSALSARGSGLSKTNQEIFNPLSTLASFAPAIQAPFCSVKPARLAVAPDQFASLTALRVVILQI